MRYRIVKMKWITRLFIQTHRDHIFLFGDNLARRGFGGQAAQMRGEPNTVGIPTKKLPSNQVDAFFTDLEFEQNKVAIDEAFRRLSLMSSTTEQIVVVPSDGLGTGRAQLAAKAPRTLAYLQERLKDLSSQPTCSRHP